MQLLASNTLVSAVRQVKSEYGSAQLTIVPVANNVLFAGIPQHCRVFMNHQQTISTINPHMWRVTATSNQVIAAIQHRTQP